MRVTTVTEAREAQQQPPQVSVRRPEAPPSGGGETVEFESDLTVGIAEADSRAGSGHITAAILVVVAAVVASLGALVLYAVCKRRHAKRPVQWAPRGLARGTGTGSSTSILPLPNLVSCQLDSKESVSTTCSSPSQPSSASTAPRPQELAATDAKSMASDDDARVVTGVPVRIPSPDTMYL